MGLDGGRRPSLRGGRLDDVGVERPLDQEPDVTLNVPCFRFEHVDERMADAAPLLLRVRDTHELVEKPLARIHDAQIDAQVSPEGPLDLLPLPFAQQSVVDENAGQAIADRAVNEHRGDSRVHSPRQAADRPPARADQLANPFDLLLDVVPGSPVGNAATDPEEKIVDDLAAARRVRHFRMKQDAVERLGFVPDRRVRRVGAGRDDPEPWGQRLELVAVARPHGDRAVRVESLEQSPALADRDLGASILSLFRGAHFGAEPVCNELHPIADAEHGDAQLEHVGVGGGSARVEHRARSPGQNDPLGVELFDPLDAAGGRVDLAVDVGLAHAARDQLGELRAVIEDENPVHAWNQVVGSTVSPRTRSSSVSRWRAT